MKQVESNQKNNMTQVVAIKNPIVKIYQLSVSVLILLLMPLLLLSCSDKKKEVADSRSQANAEASIKINEGVASAQNHEIVPNKKICMVDDRFIGVFQIPIDVNGITYYGC